MFESEDAQHNCAQIGLSTDPFLHVHVLHEQDRNFAACCASWIADSRLRAAGKRFSILNRILNVRSSSRDAVAAEWAPQSSCAPLSHEQSFRWSDVQPPCLQR